MKKYKGSSLKMLAGYCKQYFIGFVIAILFAIGGSICTILGPDVLQEIVNKIVEGITTGISFDDVMGIATKLIIIYSVGAVLNLSQQVLMNAITQKTVRNIRTSMNQKLNRLPLNYYDGTTKGDLLSRVTNDVDTISQMLSQNIANLVSGSVLLVGTVFMMFRSNVILAVTTLASSVFGFGFMFFIMSKSQKHFVAKQKRLGALNGHIEEIYTNHAVVKAYNGQESAKKTFEDCNEKLYESNYKSQFLSGMMLPIMTFSGNLSYAMIFIVGMALILNGSTTVTIGTITAFVIYGRLFQHPMTTIAQAMSGLQQASAATKRIHELMSEEEMQNEDEKEERMDTALGNVEFSHAKFGYHKEKEIIHDFSVSIKAGQKVAIVGPTGAGKTTIVNLLMRFYELNAGEIRIDGIATSKLTRENIHDLFDMILQDTWIFNGSVRENLVYNKQNVTNERLDEVCEAVGLAHFIASLPDGYDTMLDENTSLSEGQKQQITIARAMLKDAPMLILDEATSSVDTRTELIIQKAMDDLASNRTSFVIAHRLSTIRNADVILVMKDGDIIEQGNHETLLSKNGFYANLYNSQFEIA